MKHRRYLPVAGTLAALSLVSAAPALAARSVSVRVEGATRTLLPARTVAVPSTGSITKGGTPAGSCAASTAAGALDVATRHRWDGTYSSGLGIEVSAILGTTLSYKHGSYWGFYVDNRYASAGICSTRLHAGEQLLFAAVPAKGAVPKPIVIAAPGRVTAGRSFTVRTFDYPGRGSSTKPVSGVRLAGARGETNSRGVATVTATHAGRLRLVGSRSGYVRSAARTITVSAGR